MGETAKESEADRVEFYKAHVEYLKHLTTLSTGSIILIATFLEKLFANPLWRFTVALALIGFMASVLSSTINYTLTHIYESHGKEPNYPGWALLLGATTLFFTWVGFLVGILSMAMFAIRNIIK